MIDKVLDSKNFAELMKRHTYEVMELLIKEGVEFSVAAEIEHVSFSPELPKEIVENFAPISLFVLAGYTYESLILEKDNITFEAGFGKENIGSFVTIPLLAIRHILLDDLVIAVNMATFRDDKHINESEIEHSMDIFLSNPENEKIIKKNRSK